MMFDLKTIGLVLAQLEEEKGLKREVVMNAIEEALASAYKKEFGKRGQLIRASFNLDDGSVEYSQIKIAVNPDDVLVLEEEELMPDQEDIPEEERKIRFNPEQHLMIENAKMIKTDVSVGEELVFPLETQEEFSRVAAQAAKQVIMQKIRAGEKEYLAEQFGGRQGEIISGEVERVERGAVFVNLGKAEGIIAFNEQIRSERFKTGDRIRAYLFAVEDQGRGIFLKLSRTHPEFLRKLFEIEVPELNAGTVEIKRIAREPGMRSKIAVHTSDEEIDPIGSMVGQNGARVTTVTSELSGERIDIIEWSEDPVEFITAALSPAKVMNVDINESDMTARVEVSEDQFSLAIGRGGQNARLSAKLTGYKIDIIQIDAEGNEIVREERKPVVTETESAPAINENIEEQEKIDETVADITAEETDTVEATDAVAEVSEPTDTEPAVDSDTEAIEELVEDGIEKTIEVSEPKGEEDKE